MRVNLSRRWRLAIYIGNLLLAPAVAYALDKGLIGEAEVKLWAAEVAAAFVIAGLNVPGRS